jgi:hypothetical protein
MHPQCSWHPHVLVPLWGSWTQSRMDRGPDVIGVLHALVWGGAWYVLWRKLRRAYRTACLPVAAQLCELLCNKAFALDHPSPFQSRIGEPGQYSSVPILPLWWWYLSSRVFDAPLMTSSSRWGLPVIMLCVSHIPHDFYSPFPHWHVQQLPPTPHPPDQFSLACLFMECCKYMNLFALSQFLLLSTPLPPPSPAQKRVKSF